MGRRHLQEQNEEDWSNPLPSSNNAPPEGPAWWVERSQAFNAHGISPRGKKGELQTPRDGLVSQSLSHLTIDATPCLKLLLWWKVTIRASLPVWLPLLHSRAQLSSAGLFSRAQKLSLSSGAQRKAYSECLPRV